MSRTELLGYEVEKEVYDMSDFDELAEIMELIGAFIDGCDQVLVNNRTIYHKKIDEIDDGNMRRKLIYTPSAVLKPYFDRSDNNLIVSIIMHSGIQGLVFQVIFDKANKTATTRGFRLLNYIRSILLGEIN